MIKSMLRDFLYSKSLHFINEPNRAGCGNKLLGKLKDNIPDIDKVSVRCYQQKNIMKSLTDFDIIETMHGVVVHKNEDRWHEFLIILDGTRYHFTCRSDVINTDLKIKRAALTFSRITYNLHRDYMAEDEL